MTTDSPVKSIDAPHVEKGRGLVRTILSVVFVLLALVVGVGLFMFLASFKTQPQPREIPKRTYNVEVFDVEHTDLQEIISAFGTARSLHVVVVSAQISGEVVSVHPRLEVGESFQSKGVTSDESGQSRRIDGDLLLSIDPEMYQERLTQAESQIEQDHVEIRQLEQIQKNNARRLKKAAGDHGVFQDEYDRVKGLREKGIASPSELATALLDLRKYEDALIKLENEDTLFKTKREQVESRLKTRTAEKKLAQLDVRRTQVRPPFNGVLSEVMVEKGQYMRVGDPLVKLTNYEQIEVPVALSLNDYAKLAREVEAGKQPPVDLAENETAPARWHGYVTRIAPEADHLTRTVLAFVEVDNSKQDVPLLPGTFVHARIDGPILHDAVVVPRDSIVNGRVFVVSSETAQGRPVKISRKLQSLAIVTQGIGPGDEVIMTNLDIIRDDAQVTIQSHHTLRDELSKQRTRVARQLSVSGMPGGVQDKPVN